MKFRSAHILVALLLVFAFLVSISGNAKAQDFTAAAYTTGGSLHTCSLTTSGGVKCWGGNGLNQVGASSPDRTTPIDARNLVADVVKLTVGANHNCVVLNTGAMKCWGLNNRGQLGVGTNSSGLFVGLGSVVGIGAGSNVIAVATGDDHTCVILGAAPGDGSGEVRCWGLNASGQLGDGTTTDRNSSVGVVGLAAPATAIAAGTSHTCALLVDATIQCWGGNAGGQLGNGSNAGSVSPVTVTWTGGGFPVKIAAAAESTCAISGTATLRCWGVNVDGRLGDGTTENRNVPTDVVGLAGLVDGVAPGAFHTCAWRADGALYCWGRNASGQLGNGSFEDSTTPVLTLSTNVASAGGRGSHTCATLNFGGVRCWGSNSNGQLGMANNFFATFPVNALPLFGNVTSLSAGNAHTCVSLDTGEAACWGANESGQLGRGHRLASGYNPASVVGASLPAVAKVSAGATGSCALTQAGGVQCWGDKPGNGSVSSLYAVAVTGLASGATDIASGGGHSCAVTATGGVKCWGLNTRGQLGNGTTVDSLVPVDVPGLANVLAISTGDLHTCAIVRASPTDAAGTVKCWGANNAGQLSALVSGDRSTPVDASLGTTAKAIGIAAGKQFTCILLETGGVMCGGQGYSGFQTNLTGATSGVAAITAGGGQGCLITTGGETRCWGVNTAGAVGDGTRTTRNPPPVTVRNTGRVVSVAAGGRHSCALTVTNVVKCWGDFASGQLGNGFYLLSEFPVAVQQGDKVPEPFAFVDATGVAASTLVASAPVTIIGLTAPAPISVFNGEYSIGCTGTYTVEIGTIASGETVCVRHTSAAGPGETVVTSLTVGVVQAEFRSTTQRLSQAIDFPQPADIMIHLGPMTLAATASSGLPLSFVPTANTSATCKVTGNTVTFHGVGLCTIVASQPGNPTYLPAADVTRTFTILPSYFTISVAKAGAGSGTVSGSVYCGTPCTAQLYLGSTVTLNAIPDTGSVFAGWSGGGCSGLGACAFTVSAHATITATFTKPAPPGPRLDLNDDRRGDLLFHHADGRFAAWIMDGFGAAESAEIFPAGTLWDVVHIADLSGDGKADLVWQHPDGRITIYVMDRTSAATKTNLLPAGGGWAVTATGDLDGDGKSDLLLKNVDGTVAAYLMNGGAVANSGTLLAPSGWTATKTGDFDGDGKSDILFTHADGRVAIWLMNGLVPTATAQILNAGSGWSVTHVADFDGDGRSDLLWQHTDGSVAIWLMNGTAMTSGSGILNAGSGWSVTHVADFDGDRKADLYFRHTDGRAAIFLMNGLVPAQTTQILNAGSGWSAKRVQDMNQDGKADIVWEHTDGRVAVWLMNGTAMTSGSEILGPGTGWVVSGVSP
ncbi:hypothetical protein BWI17_13160 [Betaproteobacteria bacterium GR16-43]|nr:hypothetical protein BWI17_13160 [Betaproteobacteria bacterium GR16-43]